jgi:hypothetical protein
LNRREGRLKTGLAAQASAYLCFRGMFSFIPDVRFRTFLISKMS